MFCNFQEVEMGKIICIEMDLGKSIGKNIFEFGS